MTQIPLPSVITEYPRRCDIKRMESIVHVGVALKVARRIHMRCRLAEAQNWKCCWCGIDCIPEPNQKHSATIEHVTPRSFFEDKKEADVWENLAMACARCNHNRGTLGIEDFMAGKLPEVRSKEEKKAEKADIGAKKRMRKYIAHIERFNEWDWLRNGERYDPGVWLASLRISKEALDELCELVEFPAWAVDPDTAQERAAAILADHLLKRDEKVLRRAAAFAMHGWTKFQESTKPRHQLDAWSWIECVSVSDETRQKLVDLYLTEEAA